jgi:hypothetical protein
MSYPLLAPLAGEYSKDATALVGIINRMSEGVEKKQLVLAYADSLKTIWIVMCALSAVGLVASLWTKKYSLDQEHKTAQGYQGNTREADPESGADIESISPSLRELDRLAIRRTVSGGTVSRTVSRV